MTETGYRRVKIISYIDTVRPTRLTDSVFSSPTDYHGGTQ